MSGDSENPPVKDVLYVEDQPINVLLMRALFELRPSLRLHIAQSGDEALRCTTTLRPLLLLLDLQLPDCRGTELLERLQRLEAYSNIPAIAVTAESDFSPIGTGFLEVWAKPLDLRQALVRLDQLLNPACLDVPSAPGLGRSETASSDSVLNSPRTSGPAMCSEFPILPVTDITGQNSSLEASGCWK